MSAGCQRRHPAAPGVRQHHPIRGAAGTKKTAYQPMNLPPSHGFSRDFSRSAAGALLDDESETFTV
jgi:hypothetical protein